MKPPKQYEANVFRQEPAINEVAQLFVVGLVFGSHDDCWKQAKALVKHPVLQLKAENNKLREKMRTAAWALNQTRADLEGTLWPNSGMATGK